MQSPTSAFRIQDVYYRQRVGLETEHSFQESILNQRQYRVCRSMVCICPFTLISLR